MSALSTSVQRPAAVNTAVPVPDAEIDRTCATPVFLLALSALKWLVLSSIFGILAAVKLVAPSFLAHCPWLTYGRVQPAFTNTFLYGFALQAALAVGLWLSARLSRNILQHRMLALFGTAFWNTAVLIGLLCILSGNSTGFEWLEMPGAVAALLFVGYALIAFPALMTIHTRRSSELYVSQVFVLAALFWFPWIYSSANLLLNFFPVRGAMQAVVDWWFMNNFSTICLGFSGLGILFYFEPKLRGNPLYSRQLAWMAFWFLALFGSLAGVPANAPVPAWIRALSGSGSLLSTIAIIAVALNIYHTCGGTVADWLKDSTLRFLFVAAGSFVVGGALKILNACPTVQAITQFTHVGDALTHLTTYGFFAMAAFGALYYILPQLLNVAWPSPTWIKAHWAAAVAGTVLIVLGLGFAGYEQGHNLANPSTPFATVISSSQLGLQLNLLGQLVLAAGHALALLHLCWLCLRCPCNCYDLKTLKSWLSRTGEVQA